jgi:WD40 repeat protein
MVSVWSSDPNKIEAECTAELETQGGSIYSLTTTDTFVIAGTSNHLIHVWDTSTYSEVASLSGHAGTVSCLAVMQHPSGNGLLFSSSYDHTVRVWTLDTFVCIQTLVRHENSVDALAVRRGWIFSGACDSEIKVWE